MKTHVYLAVILTLTCSFTASTVAQTKTTQLVLANGNGSLKLNPPTTPGSGTRSFDFPQAPTGSKIVMSESTNGQTIGGSVTFTGAVEFGTNATLAIGGSSGNVGDVLTRSSNGGFSWQTPSGGGGSPITLTLTSPLTIAGGASADLSTNRTIALDLSVANTWSGAQTFPQTTTQGNLLVSSINAGDQAIGVAHGGTGHTSFTTNKLLVGNGASTIGEISGGSDGNVLTLVGGVPTWQSSETELVLSGDATNTQTALQDITGLSFTAGANEVWEFEADLKLGSSNTNGITFGVDVPSGNVTGIVTASTTATSAGVTRIPGDNSASSVLCTLLDQNHFAVIHGYATIGATGGTVQIKWGRGGSGTSTIYSKSRLKAKKLS